MAYDELPQIDSPSEHDDEAKNRFTSIFSQKSGFIPREQSPDKGNDYLVELIEERSAKNNHFCVQLKSVENPAIIEGGTIISFQWLTSRLGYVMRNVPIFGILVIYDVSTEKLYYEYVDVIYQKLLERETDKWKDQIHVNVHVPIANLLDKKAATDIHANYLKRFTNLGKMAAEHGESYDLPAVKMGLVNEFDLSNTADIVNILERLGLNGIEVNDIPLIHDLITRLPNSEIVKHKSLCILAGIAFNEVGKIADSAFYVQRVQKRFELNASEKLTLKFLQLKNDYSLGVVEHAEFISESRDLLSQTDDKINQITLKLNILNFELMQVKPFTDVPEKLATDIGDLAELIQELEENSKKYHLKLWNLENLALFMGTVRVNSFNEMTILERFGRSLTLPERLVMAQRLAAMQNLFTKELHSVDEFAKSNDNKLLQAYAILANTRHKLSFEIDLVSFSKDPGDLAEREKSLAFDMNLTQHGVAVFIDNSLLSPAYTLMCLASEIHVITTEWFGLKSPILTDHLEEGLRYLEGELELSPFDSRAKRLINKKLAEREVKEDPYECHGMRALSKLDHQQMENVIGIVLLSGKFPNAKKEHMLNEMESFKLFYQRCTDPDIYPLVSQLPTNFVYSVESRYQLRNMRTGILSLNSSNMKSLLETWGY